jgi:hypothetical protein
MSDHALRPLAVPGLQVTSDTTACWELSKEVPTGVHAYVRLPMQLNCRLPPIISELLYRS